MMGPTMVGPPLLPLEALFLRGLPWPGQGRGSTLVNLIIGHFKGMATATKSHGGIESPEPPQASVRSKAWGS